MGAEGGPGAGPAIGGDGGGTHAVASRSRRDTLLGVALALAFLLAAVSIVLLWQISDRIDEVSGDGGTPAEQQPLPPPSQGQGRALIQEFDNLSKQITGPLDDVLVVLRSGQLDQIAPTLQELQQNTAALPQTVEALNTLILQTQGIGSLGTTLNNLTPTLAGLTSGVGDLAGGIPGLAGQLGDTRGQLASTAEQLAAMRRTIEGTNSGLEQLAAGITAAVQALDRTRASIDRTNQCLETPVVCGASDASSGQSPLRGRAP